VPFSEVWVSVLLFLLYLGGLLIAWLVRRRRQPKSFTTLILRLTLIAGTAAGLVAVLSGMRIYYPLVWPISLFSAIVSSIIALLVTFRLFGLYLFRSDQMLDYSQSEALRGAVSTILDSERFLTALRTTLPQGKEDKEFGLDYIPYMLSSVDERRKGATKSARLFLLATVVTALVFSAVVMYFGYIGVST